MSHARWPSCIALVLTAGCSQAPPATDVRASGHVEATEVRVAPEVGGRVQMLGVDEGDTIEAGTIVLRLDTRDAALALERALADRSYAQAQLRLLEAGSRVEDVHQAEAQAEAARSELESARAELAAAVADLDRFDALLKANAGSRKQRDDAATRTDVARARLQAGEARIKAADQLSSRLRAGSRPEELAAARARITAANAQIATIEKAMADATLTSPSAGIVTETLVEVGEVIAPRTPVVVVTDLANAWADVFVPEPMIPRIRLSQPATVLTDAGGSGLHGTVSYISPKAEFTPRNVQTAEERSKLVYRVRIRVDNTEGVLKLGMPVEAVIALRN
jgi:HlyD family secretion protein